MSMPPPTSATKIRRMGRAVTDAVRSADVLRWFAYGAYGAFHLLSLYTTTYGIGFVMQAEGIVWVVSLFLSLAVQIMIGVSGHRLRQGWRRRQRGVAVASTAILMLCVSISIGFAYAFWWDLLRSERVARDVAAAQNDRIIRPVQVFTYNLSVAADSLERLASYSAERAATEDRVGGTCEAVGVGDGPRKRLREADERMFASLAARLSNAAAEARAAVEQLQELRESYDPARHDGHEAAVYRLMQQVRPLVTASYEPTIAQLEARIARGRDEMVGDRGQRFRCRDSHLEDFVQQAIVTLRHVQDAGSQTPTELTFHRPDHQASLAVAYSQLGSLVGFTAGADRGSPARDAIDPAPLLFAMVVDVVIFLVPLMFPAKHGGGDYDGDGRDFVGEINEAVEPEPRTPDIVTRRLLSFAFDEDPSRTPYDVLDRFRVECRHRDEVVLPFDLETPDSRAARKLLHALGRRAHNRRIRLTRVLRRKVRQDLGNAKFATVYRLEPGLMIALAQERVRESGGSPAVAF